MIGLVPRGVLLASLALASAALAQTSDRRVFVFGDSLTWGWTPARPMTPTVRQPRAKRWTTVMEAALGDGHELIVDGLNGRTTNVDDPGDPALDGAARLPAALGTHAPLDLVVIMLGTNDKKRAFDRSAYEIALGASELIDIVQRSSAARGGESGPQVLLISPPALGEEIDPRAADDFAGGREKSRWLPTVYRAVARAAGESFLDAGAVVSTDGIDGIHLTAEANARLGVAVAERVRELLDEPPG